MLQSLLESSTATHGHPLSFSRLPEDSSTSGFDVNVARRTSKGRPSEGRTEAKVSLEFPSGVPWVLLCQVTKEVGSLYWSAAMYPLCLKKKKANRSMPIKFLITGSSQYRSFWMHVFLFTVVIQSGDAVIQGGPLLPAHVMLDSALAVAAVSCSWGIRAGVLSLRLSLPSRAPELTRVQHSTAESSHLPDPCPHWKQFSVRIDQFSSCHDKILWQKPFREGEGFLGPHFEAIVHHGGRATKAGTWSNLLLCIHSQEPERDKCLCLVHFSPLSYSPVSQLREWNHPQWTGLPDSVDLVKVIPLWLYPIGPWF